MAKTRKLSDPNNDNVVSWTEKVIDPDGDVLDVDLFLTAEKEPNQTITEVKPAEEVSWLSVNTNFKSNQENGSSVVFVNISADVSELEPQGVYEFEAVAKDSKFSTPKTFELRVGEAPEIETRQAEAEETTAFLKGAVLNLGQSSEAEAFFEYRETGASSFRETARQTVTEPSAFDFQVNDLNANTEHEFRAKIEIGNGRFIEGNLQTFTTEQLLTVTTDEVKNVTESSATIDGTVETLGGASEGEAFFEYKKSLGGLVSTDSVKELAIDDLSITSVEFRADGEQMFVLKAENLEVAQYSLGQPWDISTINKDPNGFATPINTFPVSSQETAPTGLSLKPDGSGFFIVGEGSATVYEYATGNQWDISGSSLQRSFDVSSEDANPSGIHFDPDGRNFYISGSGEDRIYQYKLDFAFDVTSASLDGSFNFSNQGQSPRDIFASQSGRSFYVVDTTNNSVFEYFTDDAFEIESVELLTDFDVSSFDGSPRDIYIRPPNRGLYVAGRDSGKIYQFNIPEDAKTTDSTTVTSPPTSYSQTATGLDPDSFYLVEAVVEASDGDRATGNVIKFKTQRSILAETNDPTEVTTTSAVLNGRIRRLGESDSVDATFKFKESGASSFTDVFTTTLQSTGFVSTEVTGLDETKTYEFKLVAEAPDGDVAEGQLKTFSPVLSGSVSTTGFTADKTAITFEGRLETLDFTDTQGFFRFRQVGDSSFTETSKQTLSSEGTFTQQAQNLPVGTDFEFKAVIENPDSTVEEGSLLQTSTDSNLQTTTDAPTKVKGQTAVLNASVQNTGGADTVEGRFQFRKQGQTSWNLTSQNPTVGSATSYSKEIEVDPNTTYEFRAYPLASDGDEVFGDIKTFTTQKAVSVTTGSLQGVGSDFVRISGTVNSLGGANEIEATFAFRDTDANGNTVYNTIPENPIVLTEPGSYEVRIENYDTGSQGNPISLNPEQTATFRAEAIASDEESDLGQDITVQTTSELQAQTQAAGNVKPRSAKLNGELLDLGSAVTANTFFQYRKVGEPTFLETNEFSLDSPQQFSRNVDSLDPQQTYEFRAVVEASDGDRIETNFETFTTGTVSIQSVPEKDTDKISATGSLEFLDGNSADVFFEYRKAGAQSFQRTATQTLTSTGSFTIDITGLDAGSTYEIRAGAVLSTGETVTTSTQTVETDTIINVNTSSVQSVGGKTASFSGELTDIGNGETANLFFEFRKVGASAWNRSEQTKGTSEGPVLDSSLSFTTFLQGLDPNTNYEARAAVEASDGDSDRGSISNFSTTDKLEVQSNAPSSVSGRSATLEGETISVSSSADVFFRYQETSSLSVLGTESLPSGQTGGIRDLVINSSSERTVNPAYIVARGSKVIEHSGNFQTPTSSKSFPATVKGISFDESGTNFRVLTSDNNLRSYFLSSDDGDLPFRVGDANSPFVKNLDFIDPSMEGIAYSKGDGNVYMVGSGKNKLYLFEGNDFAGSLSIPGVSNPQSLFVTEAPTSGANTVFVLGSNDIYVYSYVGGGDSPGLENLEFETSFPLSGQGRPRGIEQFAGDLYVADLDFSSILLYEPLPDVLQTSKESVSSASSFSKTIESLNGNTDHFYRAYAGAGNRLAKGSEVNFTTEDEIQVSATGATAVDVTEATLNGEVTNLGDASSADVFFEYKEASVQTYNQTSSQTVSSAPATVSETISNAASGSTNEYRVVVQASDGDVRRSSNSQFETNGTLSGTTTGATSVGEFDATLNGEINNFSGASSVDVFFEFRETDSTTFTQTSVQTFSNQETPVEFSDTVSGLTTNKDHEYRVRLESSDGKTAKGSLDVFRTGARPAVSADQPTVDTGQIVANATLSDLGSSSEVEVFFRLIRDGSIISKSNRQSFTSSGSASATFTGLDPDVPYKYVVVAESVNEPFKAESSFNTRTDTVLDIEFVGKVSNTSTTATLEGDLLDAGGATSSDVFFDTRLSGSGNNFTRSTGQSIVSGTYTEQVSGLSVHEVYDARAAVEAGDGDSAVSSTFTFNTDILVAEVTDKSGTSLTIEETIKSLNNYSSVDATLQFREAGGTFSDVASTTTLSSAGETITFNQTGLNPQTTYEFRTRGVLSDSTEVFSVVKSATTEALVDVATLSASEIDETDFVAAGQINGDGDGNGIDTVSFEYREVGGTLQTVGPATFDAQSTSFPNTNTFFYENGSVKANISGLNSGTDYEFRFKATANDGDSGSGQFVTVSTNPLPQVETNDPVRVGSTSFLASGTVTNLGGASNGTARVQYRRSGDTQWQESSESVSISSAPKTFSIEPTGVPSDSNLEHRIILRASDDPGVQDENATAEDTATGGVVSLTTDPEISVVVLTQDVQNVTDTTFTVKAEVESLGGASNGDAFFQYRIKSQDDSNPWRSTDPVVVSGPTTYEQTIEGLQPQTQFEYRAVVRGSDGDVDKGNALSITTQPNVVVITEDATRLGAQTADLNAEVASLGGATDAEAFFEYRQIDESNFQRTAGQTISSTGTYTESIGGLKENSRYEFRSVVENPNGNVGYGVSVVFDSIDAVDLSVSQPTDITSTSAILQGSLDTLPGANSADMRFEIKEDSESSFTETAVATTLESPGQSFSLKVTGLSVGTVHQVRPVAEVSNGDRIVGPETSFETTDLITVRTEGFDSLADRSVTLEATFQSIATADSAETYIQYRQTGETTWRETPKITVTDSSETPLNFREEVTGLEEGTEFEFRAAVDGTGVTIGRSSHRGDILKFSTGPAPSVTTLAPSNVSADNATLDGDVTDFAGASSVEAFFEYRETGQSSYQESNRVTLNSTGTYSVEVTGLTDRTDHEYRARVLASDEGIDVGSLETFQTQNFLEVRTTGVNVVNFQTVEVSGSLDDLGGAQSTQLLMEYRETGASSFIEVPASEGDRQTTTSNNENFTVEFDGLNPETSYEFRAKAVASDGDVETGSIISKSTPAELSLVTNAATNIGSESATLNGEVKGLGGFGFTVDTHFRHRQKSRGSEPYDFEYSGLIRGENGRNFRGSGISNDGKTVFSFDGRNNNGLYIEQFSLEVPFSTEGGRRVTKQKEYQLEPGSRSSFSNKNSIDFYDSGNYLTVVYNVNNGSTQIVKLLELSTPYDIGSVTAEHEAAFSYNLRKAQLNSDGSKLYILPENSHRIETHSLSQNYVLEENLTAFHTFGQNVEKRSFIYQPLSGQDDKLYFSNESGDNQGNRIYQYRVPNGLDSAELEKNVNNGFRLLQEASLTDDGKKLFQRGNYFYTLEWRTTSNQAITTFPTDVSE